jgi:hypothetical protein
VFVEMRSRYFLTNYRLARWEDDTQSIRSPVQSSSVWSAPSDGWIKVNWDASLDTQQKVLGISLIARDNLGRVKASMCYAQKYLLDPTAAEAFGARLGAEFCRRMGFDPIYLEGDTHEVVRALNSEKGSLCPFGSIIIDAHTVLAGFQSWKVNFVGKRGNKTAHYLAKLASSQQLD